MKMKTRFKINSLLKMIPPPAHTLLGELSVRGGKKIKKLKTITNHF